MASRVGTRKVNKEICVMPTFLLDTAMLAHVASVISPIGFTVRDQLLLHRLIAINAGGKIGVSTKPDGSFSSTIGPHH